MVFSKKGCRRSKIVLDFLCKESYDLRDFVALITFLRSPDGCPWDREQTLRSLARFVLEEAAEVVDAIEREDADGLREEVGDLLFEGVFLAQVSHDGLARALAPVHTAYDGDTVFTLATGRRSLDHPLDEVDLQSAAADCLSRAIVHAMLAATSIDRTADGGLLAPAWSDRSRTGTHPHL